MNVAPGTKLLHYEVVEKIGEGGMGVVWKAHDTTLGRDVAIKVLPDLFAGDPDRLARFEREARVLASLTHPGIAGIYGLHSVPDDSGKGGLRFLAMEYVAGEDLDVAVGTGQADLETVLGIGRQLCAALGAAHDNGIIHRDLKPANIRVAPDGQIKVLDFGLAKALAPDVASGTANPALSPTLTSAGTLVGTILGTAGYMSPEQARGRAADKRADIWAFGVVLYELLTGRRLFDGETVSDTLAAVLRQQPDWDALPASTPAPLRRLLKRCLERDPSRRLHDIADAGIEIEDALAADDSSPAAEPVAAPLPLATRLAPWLVAGLATIAAVWFGFSGSATQPVAPARRVETAILPPAGVAIDATEGMALSPDGSQLVFVGRDEAGIGTLWLRSLDRSEARRLPGTEEANEVFWSPDGRHVGFFTVDAMKKLELATGIVETITDIRRSYGAVWLEDGSIIYAREFPAGLFRIPSSGGTSQPVTTPEDGSDSHQWPSLLPDGRHLLYLVRGYSREAEQGEIWVGTLDGTPVKALFASNSNAVWAEPGFIVWWADGNLRAQRFDVGRLELVGEPFPVAAGVAFDQRDGFAGFSVSAGGVLVYRQGGLVGGTQLVWVDRNGTELQSIGPAASFYYPSLSPDGKQIAIDRSDETNRGDIWVLDAATGSGTPLTSFPEDDSDPEWSPDGTEIAFYTGHSDAHPVIYVRPARGAGEARLLLEDPDADLEPLHWVEGRLLVLRSSDTTRNDIYVYSFADGSMRPVRVTEHDESDARISPDGNWIVYVSDETGVPEIYVQRFAEGGDRWKVSSAGGAGPQWNRAADELFYLSPSSELMSVAISTDATGIVFEPPQPLFRADLHSHNYRQYDTLDGQRFLLNRAVRPAASTPLIVVQGWAADRDR